MLTEARDLGEELGDTEIRAEAMAWRVPMFVALCDLDAARREVAALRATAERTAQPFMLHVAEHYGSAIALCDGRLAEAEARAQRSHEWSRLLTGRDASGVHGIQMFSIRREQGRLAELAPVIRILAADAGRNGPWRPGLASVLVELGMEREARRELARVADEGLDRFRESLWLASLTYLTDACVGARRRAVAALLYPELEPLGGENVMIGHLVACHGHAAGRRRAGAPPPSGPRRRAAERPASRAHPPGIGIALGDQPGRSWRYRPRSPRPTGARPPRGTPRHSRLSHGSWARTPRSPARRGTGSRSHSRRRRARVARRAA